MYRRKCRYYEVIDIPLGYTYNPYVEDEVADGEAGNEPDTRL